MVPVTQECVPFGRCVADKMFINSYMSDMLVVGCTCAAGRALLVLLSHADDDD